MTRARRETAQILTTLDDIADVTGVPLATDTREASRIIAAVERHVREHHRGTADMVRADLIFRCSRCYDEFTVASVADRDAAVEAILAIGRLPMPGGRDIGQSVPHECGGGRIGVAEFIGCDPTQSAPTEG